MAKLEEPVLTESPETRAGTETFFLIQAATLGAGGLPAPVEAAANTFLLNVLGTAIGAARHTSVDALVATRHLFGANGTVPVPGRTEQLTRLHAATVTGFAAHLDDFDDTDLATVIHPSATSLASALALVAGQAVSGEVLLKAFAVGCEVQIRIGHAVSPWHYDDGWHITGTCGAMGAAAAGAVVLGLDAARFATAVRLAANATVGTREGFGSSIKPFNAGKAAANGVRSALLAARDFSAPPGMIEGPSGFTDVLSSERDLTRLLDGLGDHWLMLDNVVKPYPCGIVCHPCIDAGVELSSAIADVEAVAHTAIHCNPLVIDLTGKLDPVTGLEARFSTVHGVAAGLMFGGVGLAEYDDALVVNRRVRRLRSTCELVANDNMPRDACRVVVTLTDGSVFESFVEHARGSIARPLTSLEVEQKVAALVEPTMPGSFNRIWEAVRGLSTAPDLSALWDAITPASEPASPASSAADEDVPWNR